MTDTQNSPNLMTTTALSRLIATMTPMERAHGRFLRAPDHDAATGGGDAPADDNQGTAGDGGADDAGNGDGSDVDKSEAGSGDQDQARNGDADPSLMDGGKGQDDEDDGGDDDKEAAIVPDAYELTPPEGFEIDAALLDEATPVLKELKLTNDQANQLMPLVGKISERIVTAQTDAHQEMATQWAKDAKADPEIGGKNWTETEALVAKALDRFVGPKEVDGKPNAFRQLLNESKLGNHPEMIRAFRKIGAAISEDGELPHADTGAPVKVDRLATLYPNDVKEGAN